MKKSKESIYYYMWIKPLMKDKQPNITLEIKNLNSENPNSKFKFNPAVTAFYKLFNHVPLWATTLFLLFLYQVTHFTLQACPSPNILFNSYYYFKMNCHTSSFKLPTLPFIPRTLPIVPTWDLLLSHFDTLSKPLSPSF